MNKHVKDSSHGRLLLVVRSTRRQEDVVDCFDILVVSNSIVFLQIVDCSIGAQTTNETRVETLFMSGCYLLCLFVLLFDFILNYFLTV